MDACELLALKKADAIARWGAEVVETARDYYETDFDKILFAEDKAGLREDVAEWLCPAGEFDVYERCSRAYYNTHGHWHAPDLLENIRNHEGHMITPKYDTSWDADSPNEELLDFVVQTHKIASKILLLGGRHIDEWWSELVELQTTMGKLNSDNKRVEEVSDYIMALMNDHEFTKKMHN